MVEFTHEQSGFAGQESARHDVDVQKSIKNWKELYKLHPKAAQLVYELYKKDFEHFGYKIIAP